jgi:hypothetical protein
MAPARSYGIWLGDNHWTGNSTYFPPAGSEKTRLASNNVSNVTTQVVIDGGAS